MTKDKEQVIAMAREAGATPYTNRHYPDRPTHTFNVEQLEKFATLVRNAALEECAELAQVTVCDTHIPTGINIYGTRVAKSIRNLKEPT